MKQTSVAGGLQPITWTPLGALQGSCQGLQGPECSFTVLLVEIPHDADQHPAWQLADNDPPGTSQMLMWA